MAMEVCLYDRLGSAVKAEWLAFLNAAGLQPRDDAEFTVMLRDDSGAVTACASRCGSILKYFAVDPSRQGEGLTATLMTELRREAFMRGIGHLFLYTKPDNALMFQGMRFYPVASTRQVLLMEDRPDGVKQFLSSLTPPVTAAGCTGAIVMNASPFTLGHRYLVCEAAKRCDKLLVFVLSEENGSFPAADRLELVRRGCGDLDNVTVYPAGDYLISSATFPDYFLHRSDSVTEAQCALDCRIFGQYYAPHFNITRRFAGTEPLSETTACYNRSMASLLPEMGIDFNELPRLCGSDGRPISASRVRALLGKGKADELRALVPESTYFYLESKGLI